MYVTHLQDYHTVNQCQNQNDDFTEANVNKHRALQLSFRDGILMRKNNFLHFNEKKTIFNILKICDYIVL